VVSLPGGGNFKRDRVDKVSHGERVGVLGTHVLFFDIGKGGGQSVRNNRKNSFQNLTSPSEYPRMIGKKSGSGRPHWGGKKVRERAAAGGKSAALRRFVVESAWPQEKVLRANGGQSEKRAGHQQKKRCVRGKKRRLIGGPKDELSSKIRSWSGREDIQEKAD